MDVGLHDILKEKLGDGKVTVDGEEKNLFDIVADWEDGLTKVKKVNEEIKGDREKLRNTRRELEERINGIETQRKEMEEQIKALSMTDEDKKRLEKMKKGGYIDMDEFTRKENAFQDKLNELSKKLEDAENARKQEQEERLNASMTAAQEKLKGDVISELSKHDIPGDRAEMIYYTMQNKGNVGVSLGDDGALKRTYTLIKDGREMEATLEQLGQYYADSSPWARNSSGKKGPGDEHGSGTGEFNNDGNYLKMIRG